MVKHSMDLLELLRKRGIDGDVDFLREALRFLVDGIMDAEVSAQIGAEHGERCPASTIFAGSCCLIQKCYRNFSTWGPPQPALIPALQGVPPWAHRQWRRPAFWP